MKSTGTVLAANGTHENWVPLMEMSSREVFELMLSSELTLPEANPALYLTASLAITFPFNITVGIPIYYEFARYVLGSP